MCSKKLVILIIHVTQICKIFVNVKEVSCPADILLSELYQLFSAGSLGDRTQTISSNQMVFTFSHIAYCRSSPLPFSTLIHHENLRFTLGVVL